MDAIKEKNMKKIDGIAVLCILTAGLLINWGGLMAPGMWWTDESRHAMHGAFFVDFLRDLPISDPYGYVQRYFAQYPAIAFNWYLPLFPTVMGLLMMFTGTTEISAHATVIIIWVLGVVGWYAWLSRQCDWLTALASSLALLSMPVVVLWSRSVMLEAPAVAMCLLGVLFFQRYLDRPGHTTAIIAGLVLFTALLVKQTTLFILPVLLIYALSYEQGRLAIWRKTTWWGLALVSMALLVIAVHALQFGPEAVRSGESSNPSGSIPLASFGRWVIYGKSLYFAIGPAVSVLALFGMVLSLYSLSKRKGHYLTLPLAWLAGIYLWVTYLTGVPGNSQRYAFYAMPAIVFFAAYGVWFFAKRPALRWGWAAALFLAIAWHIANGIRTPHLYVSGYETAARLVYSLPNSGTILFAGKHDGNFIFHMRNLDQERKRIVLRGDKTLVSMSVHKYFGVQSNVSDSTSVQALLAKHGVRWIVVESRDIVGLAEFKLLHKTLQGPDYRLVESVPVSTNVPEFKELKVLIYENLVLQLPENGRIRIDYPYLGRAYDFTFPDAIKQ
jgi:hypothetical protein